MVSIRRTFRRIAAATAAGVLVVVALPPLGGSAIAERDGIEVIGKLPRFGSDVLAKAGPNIIPAEEGGGRTPGTIMVFPEVRRLWHIYQPRDAAGVRTVIAVRDLDSLKLVDVVRYPTGVLFLRTSGEWMHALDPGKRVFFASADHKSVIEVDIRTMKHRQLAIPSGTGPFPLALGGLTYDPVSNSVLALFGEVRKNELNTVSLVGKVSLVDGSTDFRVLRACNGPLTGTMLGRYGDQILLPAGSPYVYIPCARAGYAAQVLRIKRDELLEPASTEDVVVGPVQLIANFADHNAGRLYMITTGGQIWVFDAESMSFVGVVGAHQDDGDPSVDVGYGLDRQTGRLFFQSQSLGVGVVEARFFPVPQARTRKDTKDKAAERVYSDPKTNRVFVLPGTSPYPDYLIYRVDPAAAPPAPPNPDAFTLNVEEREGVTEGRFFGSGSGYGARVLLANGAAPIVPAPAFGVVAPTAKVLARHLYSTCSFSDRELMAGRVSKAEMDTGSTAAEAIAVEVDDNTKIDLDQPSRCDIQGRDDSGQAVFKGLFATAPQLRDVVDRDDKPASEDGDPEDPSRWDKETAFCTTSTGEPTATSDGSGGEHPMGTQRVVCRGPGERLEADAEAALTGAVTVRAASSTVRIERTPKGVTSIVESVARGIDLAGVIQIGEVRAKAVSVADGRPNPGKADGSIHEFSISGVVIAGTVVCRAECDPRQVEAQLNTAVAGRGQFRVASGLDDDLRKGTPGGALTAVQKSVRRQASDAALVGDTTLEIPTLELIMYNDNTEWGRARQLYQFAGVTTGVSYNIVRVPNFGPLPEIPPLPDVQVPAPTVQPTPTPTLAPRTEAPRPRVEAADAGQPSNPLTQLVRGLILLLSNPRQALLLATAWAFLLLPLFLAQRRGLLRESTG